MPRAQRTALVNEGIQRVGPHKLKNNIMATYKLQEEIKKSHTKGHSIGTEGYIQEQAESMVGGRQALMNAVARGAVRVMPGAGGLELFVFPKTTACVAQQVQPMTTTNTHTLL